MACRRHQIDSGAWKILSMVIFGLAERLHWIESGALPEIAVAIIDGIVSAIACESLKTRE
jgi:hypothetical protein